VAAEIRPANEFAKRRTRPDGAMLLGSPDTKRSTRRGRRSQSAERDSPRERRSTGSDRRARSSKPEWASRVFGGNY
jgi:hypothetical protein